MAETRFKLIISKDGSPVYELFMGESEKIEYELYATANIEEGIEVCDFLTLASRYYRNINADTYEVTLLPEADLPEEFDIKMKRGQDVFRAGTWYEDNTFEATELEKDIPMKEFQENNDLNRRVIRMMRTWKFDKFEMERE